MWLGSGAIAVELYVAAARKPALKAVTQAWMQRSPQALERHFDPTTARDLPGGQAAIPEISARNTGPSGRSPAVAGEFTGRLRSHQQHAAVDDQ